MPVIARIGADLDIIIAGKIGARTRRGPASAPSLTTRRGARDVGEAQRPSRATGRSGLPESPGQVDPPVGRGRHGRAVPDFFIGGLAVKSSSAIKANRLEQSGTPVTAQLSDYRSGSRAHTADVWLAYQYGGRSYRIWVECRDDDLCRPDRTPTIEIKVDPDQPAEFVTAAGSTDDGRTVFNSWTTIIMGFVRNRARRKRRKS